MLKREHTAAEMDNPCWKGLVSSGGLPCWVCTATGGFALDPPARLQDCRGGLFCDEPVSNFSSAVLAHHMYAWYLFYDSVHCHGLCLHKIFFGRYLAYSNALSAGLSLSLTCKFSLTGQISGKAECVISKGHSL